MPGNAGSSLPSGTGQTPVPPTGEPPYTPIPDLKLIPIPSGSLTQAQATALFRQWQSLKQMDAMTRALVPSGYAEALEQSLYDYGAANPDAAANAYFAATGLTPEQLAADPQAAKNQAIADLQTLGIMGGNTEQTIARQTARETDLARTVSLMTRQYVEVETPTEFLDNFMNGLRTHVIGLTQSGALSTPAAMWALDNANIFLDGYLGALGKKAVAGEDIYKVVGVEGEPKKLGLRAGAVETGQTVTAGVATEKSIESSINKILSGAAVTPEEQAAVAGHTAISGATGAVQGATAITGATGAPGVTTARTATTQEEQFREAQRESTMQQLEVFQMPKIAQVAALSPLDWLAQEATAKRLWAQFKTVPGTQRATATRPAGEIIAPRRVR